MQNPPQLSLPLNFDRVEAWRVYFALGGWLGEALLPLALVPMPQFHSGIRGPLINLHRPGSPSGSEAF
jgi:hypothetical protein